MPGWVMIALGVIWLAGVVAMVVIGERRKRKRIRHYMSLGMTKERAALEWFFKDSPYVMRF